jgi:hypothetical protein
MTPRPTGLAAFTRKSTPLDDAPGERPGAAVRRRGQGQTVALTVRLRRADWERLHQLAVAEGVSLQQLALTGLSKIFAGKGLPGIGS